MDTVATTMKKFLNDPADVVRESLAGLEGIHTLADLGKWFDAIAQHATDIEALKRGLRHG